jgi:beta-galactosidase
MGEKMDRRSFLRGAGVAAAAMPLMENLGTPRTEAEALPPNTSAEPYGSHIAEDGAQDPHIALAGTWKFRLYPSGKGLDERWSEKSIGEETIFLPGSTDQASYGQKVVAAAEGRLSRPFTYTGPAWYQKDITIPEVWRGSDVTLLLERCHWQTSVWIDGKSYGSQNSLSVPHIYDFGIDLEPGNHTLTICVDNTIRIALGESAHSISENTQTNWNGMIGRIELRSTPAVWINKTRVFTDAQDRTATIEVELVNALSEAATGEIEAQIAAAGARKQIPVPLFTGTQTFTVTVPLPEPLQMWDDVEPNLHIIELRAKTTAAARAFEHRISVPFGIRKFAAKGRQFVLNGRPVFLRGTVENAVFPLTAYPTVELANWRRIYRTVRDYGMNHLRFHSWCPPEVAFQAADEAGVLLHVELPVFSHHVDKTPGLQDFMHLEAKRILDAYGNHPSFALFCMGNELTGDWPFLDELVEELKQADNRRLYTYSTNNGRQTPGSTSDYWVTEETAQGRLRIDKTRFGAKPGGTDYDFSKAIAPFELPIVAHELGQWTVYPSYDEIGKYIGVLKPRNLEVFREQLAAHGMADQSADFQIASGRFAAEVYKEDIESAIRTPKLGGFQLLELTDYPGQKEAPVGMLDCFWDSKHVVSPEAFRHFCGDTVPLCSFSKFTWTSDETFRATAELAHYGKRPLRQLPASWSISDDAGKILKSGPLHSCTAKAGDIALLGEIAFSLSFVRNAMRLYLRIQVHDIEVENRWQIWVYPPALPALGHNDVLMTTRLDDAAVALLDEGRTVFLCAATNQTADHLLKLRFLPVFWSFGMFKKQPGVLGTLCDPTHPALEVFPTDMHSNWQWWELLEGTNAFILDGTPLGFRPLIQVIDDFHRNYRLGLVIEAQVGKGKLLATPLPLAGDLAGKPVSRQLLYSLLRYAASDSFKPRQSLPVESIRQLVLSPA